jgi:hypothetical protein
MLFDTETIARILRGILGSILIVAGILDNSWIVLPGFFLMMSAATGRCGLGSAGNCRLPQQPDKEEKE